ncbi:unnamed protein product [Prorocentrum cordatum]|uniref:Uncharacterized protein n=1 Tax=Prorocentrum cordatum TaxID=2364126 RepID=A0ABN9WRA1_9DINO|nr:unnamed protein product [Polarella glacialis]
MLASRSPLRIWPSVRRTTVARAPNRLLARPCRSWRASSGAGGAFAPDCTSPSRSPWQNLEAIVHDGAVGRTEAPPGAGDEHSRLPRGCRETPRRRAKGGRRRRRTQPLGGEEEAAFTGRRCSARLATGEAHGPCGRRVLDTGRAERPRHTLSKLRLERQKLMFMRFLLFDSKARLLH